MDITLTLSPITPLDVQFDTPSPSPPIFGHPIPWNLLEAHGDSCLCCIHSRTVIIGLRDELQYIEENSRVWCSGSGVGEEVALVFRFTTSGSLCGCKGESPISDPLSCNHYTAQRMAQCGVVYTVAVGAHPPGVAMAVASRMATYGGGGSTADVGGGDTDDDDGKSDCGSEDDDGKSDGCGEDDYRKMMVVDEQLMSKQSECGVTQRSQSDYRLVSHPLKGRSLGQNLVTVIEESKDLSTLSLDELIGNLKVYEVVLEKDLEISKNKKEKYKSLALKARKVLSEEEASSSDSNDEEYAMAVRDFKKFFRRRGKFVRQPHDDKKNFWKVKEDNKEKDDRRCFKCGDPNHFISDFPKHSFNDKKAFIVGCWNDSEEDTEKMCLMAYDTNEVLSDTPYYSSSSLDNESWQNEYDKL
ncbi:hypothetical protein Tco_0336033, partial [Tanacetum coccineum]